MLCPLRLLMHPPLCPQVHSACKELFGKRCPLGQYKVSIIPPTALNSIDSDGESWRGQGWAAGVGHRLFGTGLWVPLQAFTCGTVPPFLEGTRIATICRFRGRCPSLPHLQLKAACSLPLCPGAAATPGSGVALLARVWPQWLLCRAASRGGSWPLRAEVSSASPEPLSWGALCAPQWLSLTGQDEVLLGV